MALPPTAELPFDDLKKDFLRALAALNQSIQRRKQKKRIMADFDTVIGLECHVQLKTNSKLFSPAPNRFGDEPNANVDVVDAGLPGVLPVLNEKAVAFAIKLGLALGCKINLKNVFARKHYFYPDLPKKGYQISI